jgi:uncharacterized membrane-anchored protein YhcB (DUF1043 family)
VHETRVVRQNSREIVNQLWISRTIRREAKNVGKHLETYTGLAPDNFSSLPHLLENLSSSYTTLVEASAEISTSKLLYEAQNLQPIEELSLREPNRKFYTTPYADDPERHNSMFEISRPHVYVKQLGTAWTLGVKSKCGVHD